MKKIPYYSNLLILPSLILFLLVFGNNCKIPEKTSRLGKTTLDKGLESNFLNPPISAAPHVWWHWMNGNITREGITADLEAMQRVGIAGWQAFHLENSIPKGPVNYGSTKWYELMAHAMKESERLGLEASAFNCAGWGTTGGPWVTPDNNMFELVSVEIKVKGPEKLALPLDQPSTNLGYYRDIAIMAFPDVQNNGLPSSRLLDWEKKSLGNAAAWIINKEVLPDLKEDNPEDIIKANTIVNLEKYIHTYQKSTSTHAILYWDVPEGDWTVFRIGYTPRGNTNHPAPPEGTGFEIDKLSRKAAELHWNNAIKPIIDKAGKLTGNTFKSVLLDSYEAGYQAWTHEFQEEFEKRTGYSLVPYLPCLMGWIVESREVTERFLWDFRRTVSDLYMDNYYGQFAEMCHNNGMQLRAEHNGRTASFNNLSVGSVVDIPMGEFWVKEGQTGLHVTSKQASSTAHVFNKKIASAEAYTTGAPEDAGWVNHPYSLKSQGDFFFCQGVNQFSFHTYAHQPNIDPYVKPGMTMGPHGIQFNRNNTWWEQGAAWVKYLTRCQYMLQEGKPVIDIYYFVGEQAPLPIGLRENLDPYIPWGYDYDAGSGEGIMMMNVENGSLVLSHGLSYKMLVIDSKAQMRPELLNKIHDLAKAGAIIVGNKPVASPGLTGYPDCDQEVQYLAERIWNMKNVFTTGENMSLADILKKYEIKPDFEVMNASVAKGTQFPGIGIEYIHRQIGNADVYFLSNQYHERKTYKCVFRVNGKIPELWDPYNGEINELAIYSHTEDGRTLANITLDPAGSVFVVFRKPEKEYSLENITFNGKNIYDPAFGSIPADIETINENRFLRAWENGQYRISTSASEGILISINDVPPAIDIAGPWTLSFPSGLGAPAQINLDKLACWTKHPNEGVKYFSGTAVYMTEFELPGNITGNNNHSVTLDLGEVRVIAEVKLNGRDLGIFWKPPFSVDITDVCKEGTNRLEVRVTNLWPNRVIGDMQHPDEDIWVDEVRPGGRIGIPRGKGLLLMPEWYLGGNSRPESERIAWTTWRHYEKDSELLPSGLIGPVKINTAVLRNVDLPMKNSN